jgi:hypothetical protein
MQLGDVSKLSGYRIVDLVEYVGDGRAYYLARESWWLSSSRVDAWFGLLLLSQHTFLDYFRQSAARLVRVPG